MSEKVTTREAIASKNTITPKFVSTNAVDDNINIHIDHKTGDVENVFKSDYNEKTLEDVVDGNVIKA